VIPVANTSPSGLRVIPLPTLIPDLAVISPTESTLVTSSYVRVPAIETLPFAVMLVTVILGLPVNP